MSRSKGKKLLLGAAVGFGVLAALVIGVVLGAVLARPAAGDLGPLSEAWTLVEKNQPGALPDRQKVVWGAIRGALGTLGDPCASLVEPASQQVAQGNISGEWGGIGASLSQDASGAFVVAPTAGQPAERAGIAEGDLLLQVGDTALAPAMTLDEVIALIRGEVGTTVRLTLRHPAGAQPYTVDIARESIPGANLESRLLDGAAGTGYIWVYVLGARTGDELRQALVDLKAQGMTRLVLDLRGNRGGDLEPAVDVASEFLPQGPIGFVVDPAGTETTYDARGTGEFTAGPLAVLVDANTASGAELVAGSLRDRGRAVLVGEHTYGCGSMLNVWTLGDGAALYLRSADLLTASRGKIPTGGLTPDLAAAITAEDVAQGRDPQLDRALQYLAGQ